MALLGLLWSPFAAAICFLIAHIRRWHPRPYALGGAKCSALFIVLWIYSVARLCGVSFPPFVVGTAYLFVYAVWALGLIGSQISTATAVMIIAIADSPSSLAWTISWLAVYCIVVPLSVVTWGWSLRRLWRRYMASKVTTDSPRPLLPDDGY